MNKQNASVLQGLIALSPEERQEIIAQTQEYDRLIRTNETQKAVHFRDSIQTAIRAEIGPLGGGFCLYCGRG